MSGQLSPLLEDFDFGLLDSPVFKEDSVREELILPILHSLGYSAGGPNKIIRSKPLEHPFLKIGSKKKHITLIPDYILTIGKNFAFVLDAKSPNEEIKSGENVEQVYSYAVHPEIRVDQFGLCNGREFILFDVRQKEPVLYFHLSEIAKHWQSLKKYLGPATAPSMLPKRLQGVSHANRDTFDYLSLTPPPEIIDFQKQTAKRHFGVHGYFTKQVWSVVQHYIKTFTQPGDTVLDPFGGSGVTMIEALMLGRKGIHIDINPLSEFIVKKLLQPIDLSDLGESYRRVSREFKKRRPTTQAEISKALKEYLHPMGVVLPKTPTFAPLSSCSLPSSLPNFHC